MKHAGAATLTKVTDLLRELRQRTVLTERGNGVFYLKSRGFLHFHDDPSGIFADVKLDLASYSRHRVTTRREQEALLKKIDKCLTAAGHDTKALYG